MKKTICIDCFSNLPVPAVKGGAVETLLTILLEENERLQRAKLVVVSAYDNRAKIEAEKYKHSKVIFVKKHDFVKRIYNRIINILRKIFAKHNFLEYDCVVENIYLKHISADVYLTTGCGRHYYPFIAKKGKDNVVFYIHTEVKATETTDSLFRKALGVSDYVINKYYETSKWDRSNGRTVLNCTDENHFDKELSDTDKIVFREELGFNEDDFIILFAGRIIEEKGIHVLIDAINLLDDKDIKLIICGGVFSGIGGTSDYQKEMEKRVEESNGRIKCTGFIDHSALYKYFSIADTQVMASLCEEAAPLAAIEGMCCGLPLIVTNSGGTSEYVTDECAITVDKDDKLTENIAKNIKLLKDNSVLREKMSRAGKARAKFFTREKYYNDFVDAFDMWK